MPTEPKDRGDAPSAVRLEALTKSFADKAPAVDRLSLEIAVGERLVLVGPSGGGKTTTLRLIAGLERPTAGGVFLEGVDATLWPPWRRRIGMIFQNPALWPHWSARRNLSFAASSRDGAGAIASLLARVVGKRRERQSTIAGTIEDVAHRLGACELLDRMPAELSGGERQRIALARALVRPTRLLLLDEPFASLDAPVRLELRQQLARTQSDVGIAMLHVTHDQAEAMALGHRIAVLNAGRLQQIGTPEEIYDRPAHRFVAGFFGQPSMAFVEGRLGRDGSASTFEAPGWRLRWIGATPEPRERIALGIRPEQFSLRDAGAGLAVDAVAEEVAFAGSTTIVTARAGVARLAFSVPRADAPTTGSAMRVHLAGPPVHWFDADAGQRMG